MTAAIISTATITAIAMNAIRLVRHWRAMKTVIRITEEEFTEHAAQAIAVTGLWSDEENEILLGRRPFQ